MAGADEVIENLVLAIEAAGFPEAAQEVAGLRTEVVGLTESVDALAGSMDATAAGGAAAARGGKGGLFKTLTSFKTLVAGLGIVAAVKQFSSFQSQMERLRTLTNATQGEVGRMSKGILGMAVSVGTGPNSLAEALYHIESAGFRGKAALDALRVSAMGAKMGGADLTSTTTAMLAVMVAGFKGVNSLKQAMGELRSTVGAGDMTFEDLNDALSTGILATMKVLGLRVIDTGAALATLGDNNIRGAAAATRLRMGLMMLIHPSKAATEVIEGLHMKQLQLAEDLRKPNGLLVMLKDLRSHLGGLSDTQKASDLAAIFGGGRNSAAMLTLLNQMSRLEEKYKVVGKGGRQFNSDWKATTRTLSFFIDQVKALADVALVKLGGALAWVINLVRGWIEALERGKVWAVAVAGAVTFLAGTALISLVGAFFASSAAATLFGAALWLLTSIPIMLLFAAIAVAIYELITNFSTVKKVAVDAWHWIETAAQNAFNWIKGHWPLVLAILTGPFGLAVLFIVKHFDAIEGAAGGVIKWLKGAWHDIWKVITWPFEQGAKIIGGVFNWIVSHVEWAVHQIGKLIGKVLGPIKAIGGFVGNVGGGVLHAGGSVLHDLGIPGLATGGLVTGSGVALVGEHGPELVYLGRGAEVAPNTASATSQATAGTGYVPITVNLVVGRRVLAKESVLAGLEAQSCR